MVDTFRVGFNPQHVVPSWDLHTLWVANNAEGRTDGSLTAARMAAPFSTFVNLRAIGVSYAWFREQSRRLEAAGYDGVAIWDHFVSRGVRRDPVLECWTTLAALAGSTSTVRLMTFVLNVMNRPPSVVARMAATLACLMIAAIAGTFYGHGALVLTVK